MTAAIRRIIDMVLRVLGFSHENPPEDPAHLAAVARLEERAVRIQALAVQEQTGRKAAKAAQITKQRTREKVRDGLHLLARAAATAEREEPEIPVRLSLPKPHSSQQVFLTGARVVVTEARAHQELLTRYGMSASFLDQLTTMLDQYEQSINTQNSGTSMHVGASAELEDVAQEISRLVRLLDAIYRPRYRDDAEKLAAWDSAMDVRRPAAKAEGEQKTPAA
jgi:TATA-box binding protein (TBP) (component of TFIID and TFIIIB)